MQVTLIEGAAEGLKYAGLVFGIIAALPALKIAREWGSLTTTVRRTDESVTSLTHPENGVVARLQKQEFILTGVDEENGVRGDVKLARAEVQDVKRTLFDQSEKVHTALGKFETRLTDTEQRVAARRKAVRKPAGRRRGEK